MRILIQRVTSAKVTIEGKVTAAIQDGFLVLVGISHDDNQKDIDKATQKIASLRIFEDEGGKMNLSIKDIDGEILLVSQFTLFGNITKGNRPSFIEAAKPEVAVPIYEALVASLSNNITKPVKTGQFGADMKVSLTNDGPVTIWFDTRG
jgi:D-tyrosyl-tRNA(Tyr) deacylase